MPSWQRTYLVVCSGVIGFCLAYVLCDFSGWPRLTYFPYEREWRFVAGPAGDVPMSYIGIILWGAGGAIVGAVLAYVASRLARRPMSDRWLTLWGGWAVAAFVYAGLYYTWNLWPF